MLLVSVSGQSYFQGLEARITLFMILLTYLPFIDHKTIIERKLGLEVELKEKLDSRL
jgi:hypothetical protein